jgi:hypothetical protein
MANNTNPGSMNTQGDQNGGRLAAPRHRDLRGAARVSVGRGGTSRSATTVAVGGSVPACCGISPPA